MIIRKNFSITKGRRGGVVIGLSMFGRHIIIGKRHNMYFSVRNAVRGHWYLNDYLYISNKDNKENEDFYSQMKRYI